MAQATDMRKCAEESVMACEEAIVQHESDAFFSWQCSDEEKGIEPHGEEQN